MPNWDHCEEIFLLKCEFLVWMNEFSGSWILV